MKYTLLCVVYAFIFSSCLALSPQPKRARWYEVLDKLLHKSGSSKRTTISLQATSEPGLLNFFTSEGYGSDVEQTWVIQTPADQSVLVTYIVADIEGSSSCNFDRLTLTDTETESQVWTCGLYNMQCMVIHTAGSRLKVHFTSDSSVSGKGFSLIYQAVPVSGTSTENFCDSPTDGGFLFKSQDVATASRPSAGQCMVANNGVLTPAELQRPSQNDCQYTIVVPQDLVVVVVVDSVYIEHTVSCTSSSVAFKENGDRIGELLCGTNIGHCVIVSQRNTLTLEYKDRYGDSDFRFFYYPARPSSVSSGCPHIGIEGDGGTDGGGAVSLLNTNGGVQCRGLYTQGQLTSPNYPEDYFNGMNCSWNFQVARNEIIMVTIEALEIETHDDCIYDSLVLHGSRTESYKLCSPFPAPCDIVFSSSSLHVNFTTDSSVIDGGFSMRLAAEPGNSNRRSTCPVVGGGNDSTIIQHPEQGGNYGDNEQIRWQEQVQENQYVMVKFDYFDVEHSSTCSYDYLALRNGYNPDDGIKLCGSTQGSGQCSVVIPTSNLLLEFVTDGSIGGEGFRAEITGVSTDSYDPSQSPTQGLQTCGLQVVPLEGTSPGGQNEVGTFQNCTILNDPQGTLSIPGEGEDVYPNNHYQCANISAAGQYLAVKIVKLNIEHGGALCRFDALGVTHNGTTKSYCGQVYNFVIYATGDVSIEFATDSSVSGPGGMIQWQRYPPGAPPPFAVSTIDIDPCVSPRIVGGSEAEPYSHPWIVGLNVDNSRICGASIVSKDRVITAAHCVHGSEDAYVTIIAGDHTYDAYDGTEQTVEVEEVIPHPDYDAATTNNDIAVLKLKQDVPFNENIRPICVARSHPAPNTPCKAAGWGTTSEGGDLGRVLMEVDLPIVSTENCIAWSDLDITDQMFCAGQQQGGVDTCQGDSGGPLSCPIDGIQTLVGVTSWGIGCGRENHPGLYAKVAEYSNWLSQYMEL